jgi:hypothetical protein
MAHLLDTTRASTDIGHYGRLTFAMIARHFLEEDEPVRLLAGQGAPEPQSRGGAELANLLSAPLG